VVGKYQVDYKLLDSYISTLENHIKECLQHEACRKRLSGLELPPWGTGLLPTRCLELCKDKVFLRETKEACGTYVTLSHRWNQETEDTRTTMKNYTERLGGNWDCTLPKLYTDVLELAQRLSIKYVWIDSMCIIQAGDGGHDWRKEAGKMAPYYQGSLITVLASSSTREHGLYPEKMQIPSATELVRLPYRNRESRRQGHFYVYRNALRGRAQFESAVVSSNLLSRGWVFQEYHLSRRSVSFTPHGMFFECKSNGAVNEWNQGLKSEKDYHSIDWYENYLSQYSGLQLTKPTQDRLVALSGVMDEFLQSTNKHQRLRQQICWLSPLESGDTSSWWLTGLWKFNIIPGLVWQIDINITAPLDRATKFPSWSWASIVAPVSWKGMTHVGEVLLGDLLLLDGNGNPPVNATNSNALDQVPVTLHAKGKLLPVLIRSRFENEREIGIISKLSNSGQAAGLGDNPSRSSMWRKIVLPGSAQKVSGWASIENWEFQNDAAFVQTSVIYALAVGSEYSNASRHAHGNLIKKVDVYTVLLVNGIMGREGYQRIGVGKLYGEPATVAFRLCRERALILV
jgi:hypothetical protein